MFGSKLANAEARVTALLAIISATGFKPAEGEEITEAGFKAFLASREKTAAETAVAAAPATAQHAAFVAGLAALGITVKPATEGAAITGDDVKRAIEALVASRAQAQAVATIASAGQAAAIPVPQGDSAPAAGADAPATADEFLKALQGIADPASRTAYYRKHEARFHVR